MAGVNISEINNVAKTISVRDILSGLPPDISASLATLITILKAIGILFIIYLVFLIVRSIMNIIEKRRIKKIYQKVIEIDEKLDMLVKKNKTKKK
jgi:hypothetical protein